MSGKSGELSNTSENIREVEVEDPAFRKRFPFPHYVELAAMVPVLLAGQFMVILMLSTALLVMGRAIGRPLYADPTPYVLLVNPIAVFPVLAWCWWRKGGPFRAAFGFVRAPGGAVAAVVPFGLGTSLVVQDLKHLIRVGLSALGLPQSFGLAEPDLTGAPTVTFIAVAVFGPLIEETLVRGGWLGGLLRQGRGWGAVAATSLVFGLVHLHPVQAPTAFVMGLALGWLFWRTRSLWPRFAAHAVHNAGLMTRTLARADVGQARATAGASSVFQPWWMDAAGLALILLGLAGVVWATRTREVCASDGESQV